VIEPPENKWELKLYKMVMKFIHDPVSLEWISPTGLTPKDRRLLHEIAEKCNLKSRSEGDGTTRVVIITKEPREVQPSDHLNSTTLRKFREDYNIKINLCDTNDFMYFIELYDSSFQTKQKFQFIVDALKIHGGDSGFAEYYDKLKMQVVTHVKSQPGYEEYLTDSLQHFQFEDDPLLQKGDPYIESNDGQFFISLDLKSANFSSLNYYNPNFLEAQNWQQFLSRFTTTPFFLQNKLFRQRVFWLLEPLKINKITEFLVHKIGQLLEQNGIITLSSPCHFNQDELIIAFPKKM